MEWKYRSGDNGNGTQDILVTKLGDKDRVKGPPATGHTAVIIS